MGLLCAECSTRPRVEEEVRRALAVKVKKLDPEARLPTFGTPESAAMDLYALTDGFIDPGVGGSTIIKTGIAVEMPKGFFGLIRLRSGMAWAYKLVLVSSGVVDWDYRGEIQIRVAKLGFGAWMFSKGDRLAQMVLLPYHNCRVIEVEELSTTQRAEGGFGSTGR